MKISFDFDQTLSNKNVQEFCSKLIQKGFDIWIVTSRIKEFNGAMHYHDDLLSVAKNLGIPEEKIHFTNAEYKTHFLHENNFKIHIDDDYHELKKIKDTSVIGIDVTRQSWMKEFEDKIRSYL
jgi:acid phosphatase class B